LKNLLRGQTSGWDRKRAGRDRHKAQAVPTNHTRNARQTSQANLFPVDSAERPVNLAGSPLSSEVAGSLSPISQKPCVAPDTTAKLWRLT
jgi:hypothetical protein